MAVCAARRRRMTSLDARAVVELRARSMWAFVELICLRIRRSIAEARTEIAWLKSLEKRQAELDEHDASYRAVAVDAKKRGASQSELDEIEAERWDMALPFRDQIDSTETWH